ncbi:MAG: DUF1801 domain-containing protein, partial [Actinomycetes bacterium]
MNKRVDVYIKNETRWQAEFKVLRELALATGLTEDVKWGQPCYTLNNKNIFLIHGFKDYCAVLFMKGALLKDPKGILIQQTANVQAARQIRFSNLQEVTKLKPAIKAYMKEAVTIEEMGLEVPVKKAAEFEVPTEILAKLKKVPGLLPAFKKLTPGRQRAWVLHFFSAKQEKTLVSRIEKATASIL